jgi:hypothetical protein
MKRRSMLFGALLLLPLGCCATSYILLDPPWKNAKVERLRADANARVPVGSTRQQVEEWFVSHDIRYGEIIHVDTNRVVGLGGQLEDNAGLQTASIWIEFHFDEHGRVTEVLIRRSIVSL